MPRKKTPKTPAEAPLQGPTFPDLDFDDDSTPVQDTPVSDPWAEEKARLEKERDEALEARNKLQEQAFALLEAPVVPQIAPQQPREIDWDNLPDPTLDGPAYARAVADRVRAEDAEQRRYDSEVAQAQARRNERFQQVWDDFEMENPEYTEDRDKVEWAAKKVVEKLHKRGYDDTKVERYVFNHADRFAADVKSEMDRIFGPIDTELDDTPAPKTRATPSHRTEGMIGGMEGGAKPGRGAAPPPDDMFKEIKQFQIKHGFY